MSKMRISVKWLRTGVLMAVATGLCGCATIINGKKQTITINTEPAGATARVRGQAQGVKTPGTVTVNRSDLITLVISREGYTTKQVNLDRERSPWFWGNLPLCAVIFAPLGMAVDGISGGGSVHKPSIVNLALEARRPGELEKAGLFRCRASLARICSSQAAIRKRFGYASLVRIPQVMTSSIFAYSTTTMRLV